MKLLNKTVTAEARWRLVSLLAKTAQMSYIVPEGVPQPCCFKLSVCPSRKRKWLASRVWPQGSDSGGPGPRGAGFQAGPRLRGALPLRLGCLGLNLTIVWSQASGLGSGFLNPL